MHGKFQHLCKGCISGFSKNVIYFTFFVLMHALCGPHLKIIYIWVFSKSQIERITAEETQTVKNPLDTSEPAGVLGWEILEAEGAITEKQTESSLSAKEEDTSGLVKAIVGVFHKG